MPQARTQPRRIAALLTALATVLAVVLGSGAATAVQSPGFTVEKILVNGQTRDSNAPLTLEWDFSPTMGRAPLPGEGFELDLPQRLLIAGTSQGTKPLMFDGQDVGTCTFAAKKISCTFDDGITQFADRTDVAGDMSLLVVADGAYADAYTGTTIDFTFNGVTVPGSIPTGIAARRVASYRESQFSKYSTPISAATQQIPWTVDFNVSRLARENGGVITTPDGQTVQTISFTDTFGEGYNEAGTNTIPWNLAWVNSATDTSGTRVLASTRAGVGVDPRFSITRSGEGPTRTIQITGPFEADTNYRLVVPGRLTSNAQPGVEYTNTISIDGTNASVTGVRSYNDTTRLTMRMKDHFGAVSILKTVRGSASSRMPAGSTFPVTLEYTLPEGKTPQDYPGWAPEIDPSISTNSNTGTVTVNAKPGVYTNYGYLFPEGTQITVAENQPSIPGLSFDLSKTTFTPKTFTVGNRTTTDVAVVNFAEAGATGTFQVAKTVTAPAGDAAFQAPATVELTYTCGGATGTVSVPTDGTATTVGEFPAGTECAITAETGDDVAGYANAQNLGTPVTLVSGTNAANTVAVTNTYTKATAFAPVKVAKTVVAPNGDAAFAAPANVTVRYQCNADSQDGSVTANTPVELSAPTNGTATGASFPVGTECSVVAESGDEVAGYTNRQDLGSAVTLVENNDAANTVTVTNTYTKDTVYTDFKVIKNLVEPAGDRNFVSPATVNVHYRCNADSQDGAFTANSSADILVASDGSAQVIGSFPVGTECMVYGESQDGVLGYSIDREIGAPVTLVAGDSPANIITLTNTYTKDIVYAPVKVAKTVVAPNGDAAFAAPANVTVRYQCNADSQDGSVTANTPVELSVPTNGTATGASFPVGTECSVVAETGDEVAGYTNQQNLGSAVTLVENNDAANTVTVTNTYTKDIVYAPVKLAKTVVAPNGDAAFAAPANVTVRYQCNADSQDGSVTANTPVELSVPTNGTATAGASFPVGTECSVVAESGDEVAGYTNQQNLGSAVTLEENNDAANTVTVTNTYTKDIVYAGFKVAKNVQGPAGFTAPAEVQLTYRCNAESQDGAVAADTDTALTVPTNGNAVIAGSFPVGTECSVVAETGDEVAGYTNVKDLGTSVTLAEGDVPGNVVTVTNTYTKDTVYTPFLVAKQVQGPAGDAAFAAPANVSVQYRCNADSQDGAVAANVETTLSVPTTGVAVAAGQFPVGTECVVLAETGDEVAGYTNAQDLGTAVTLVEGDNDANTVRVTNTYTKNMGTFTIQKVLNDAAPAAAATKDYSFHVVCTAGGATVLEKDVTITGAGTSAPVEVATGAECQVTEDTAAAAIDGYNLVASVSGGSFTQGDAAGAVVATNTYTQKVGDFTVTKQLVDADNVAAGKTFTFTYTCTNDDVDLTDAQKSGTFTLEAGQSHTITGIPAGSTCVIVEENADVDGASLVTSGLEEITIVEDDEATATVVNTYTAWRGAIALTKELTGSGKDAAGLQAMPFTVDYTCTLGSDTKIGTVTVIPGQTTTVDGVRSGASCTFAEDTSFTAPAGLVFNESQSVTSATVTVGAKDSTVTAALRNSFSAENAVTLTKNVVGLPDALGAVNGQSFQVEATWTDAAGTARSQTLTVTDGQTVTLPAVPVGTVITLKEILPANSTLVNWGTPTFASEAAGVVTDHGDGTASLTVPATAAEITLTNTAETPFIWVALTVVPAALLPGVISALTNGLITIPGLITTPGVPVTPGTPGFPFIPGLPSIPGIPATPEGSLSGEGSSGSSAQGEGGTSQNQGGTAEGSANQGGNAEGGSTAQGDPAQGGRDGSQTTVNGADNTGAAATKAAGESGSKSNLANTGASVGWALVVALVMTALGVFFVRRSRR